MKAKKEYTAHRNELHTERDEFVFRDCVDLGPIVIIAGTGS